MKSNQLEKSIASWQKKVAEHKEKIKNPHMYYSEWNSFSSRYKAGLVKHWEHEIKTFQNDIDSAKAELERRKQGNGDK